MCLDVHSFVVRQHNFHPSIYARSEGILRCGLYALAKINTTQKTKTMIPNEDKK